MLSGRHGLRGMFVLAMLLVCAVLMGCKSSAPPEKAVVEQPVVNPLQPPSGYVLRVWSNGDCTIDIGTEVGVADGDWLSVIRKGETVQYLEVSKAQPNLSYCRVAMPENPARARVDDMVTLEPKNLKDIHGAPAK